MPNLRLVCCAGAALLLTLASSNALASPFFSIDLGSPSFAFVSNSDVLGPGPVGGPPVVVATAASLGLAGAGTDELNALTTPAPLHFFFFSVDRATVGAVGAVVPEAGFGQAAGDVYGSLLTGTNTLVTNQDVLGELPPIGSGIPVPPPIDNLDALDFLAGPGLIFAMASGHPYMGTVPGCGGDLFTAGPGLVISYITLGLVSCADDIDALQIDSDTGDVYFSLVPGSPSLGGGAFSAADIFLAPGGTGPFVVAFAAPTLGLLPSDNVDAMAWDPPSLGPVPVIGPIGITLLALLLAAAAAFAVRRTRVAA